MGGARVGTDGENATCDSSSPSGSEEQRKEDVALRGGCSRYWTFRETMPLSTLQKGTKTEEAPESSARVSLSVVLRRDYDY